MLPVGVAHVGCRAICSECSCVTWRGRMCGTSRGRAGRWCGRAWRVVRVCRGLGRWRGDRWRSAVSALNFPEVALLPKVAASHRRHAATPPRLPRAKFGFGLTPPVPSPLPRSTHACRCFLGSRVWSKLGNVQVLLRCSQGARTHRHACAAQPPHATCAPREPTVAGQRPRICAQVQGVHVLRQGRHCHLLLPAKRPAGAARAAVAVGVGVHPLQPRAREGARGRCGWCWPGGAKRIGLAASRMGA